MKSTDTHTRVEVLETRMTGVEKTLGVVLEKIDGIARAFAAQPHHTPLIDQLRIIGTTASILTAIFAGAGWWLNASVAPDRQRIEMMDTRTTDLPVLRYRVEQLEKSEHKPN